MFFSLRCRRWAASAAHPRRRCVSMRASKLSSLPAAITWLHTGHGAARTCMPSRANAHVSSRTHGVTFAPVLVPCPRTGSVLGDAQWCSAYVRCAAQCLSPQPSHVNGRKSAPPARPSALAPSSSVPRRTPVAAGRGCASHTELSAVGDAALRTERVELHPRQSLRIRVRKTRRNHRWIARLLRYHLSRKEQGA